MTQVIEKAKKRLSELKAEADKLRMFIELYDDLAGGEVGDFDDGGEDITSHDPATASPAEIVTAAKMLMRQHARPLSRSRIVKLLMREGIILPGKDKAKNVGTVIWRSKQFDNIAGQGYWPKEFGGWMGQGTPRQAELLRTTDD